MVQTHSSAGIAQNPMLYAECRRAAHHLWFLYSDGWAFPFDWEDTLHDVLAGFDFNPPSIALFSYRYKIALKKAKESKYRYMKHLAEYYEYESSPMPDVNYPDFPIGADYKTCIMYLAKQLGRPLTATEATEIIRAEDYTRRYQKNMSGIEIIMRRMSDEFAKMNKKKREEMSGLKNHNAKMTPVKQSEAKRLYELWGKKYKAIGREIGVSKDTVRCFILGHTYAQKPELELR